MTAPVIIYGASGYTGKLIAWHLAEAGIPFIAAGRSIERLEEQMALVPELKGAAFECRAVAHEVTALTSLFTGAKVVYNVAGPFSELGRPVVEAALAAGCHYLDTTGEADWMRTVRDDFGAKFAAKKLLLAPFNLHRTMVELLSQVEEAARRDEPARVVLKINALTDAELINGIVRAGRAGAKVDLIVRGACMLPPGLPGETDNILVRSVVGRFLEHSRIFYFRWGKEEQEALYLSSADWMARNMLRRIEVAWPITDPKLRQRVIDEGLTPYLHDSLDAWQLGPDGTSQRIGTEDSPQHVSAQQALMRLYHEDP